MNLLELTKTAATCSDENKQNCSQVGQLETILFIARHATRKRRHPSSTKRWKGHSVIVLLLSQLYCLEMVAVSVFLTKNAKRKTYYSTKEIYYFNNE